MPNNTIPPTFNFFQWIQDGVKRAVLLGVSDAVNTIGSPDTSGEMAAPLQDKISLEAVASTATKRITSTPATKRKRALGRGLAAKEAEAATEEATKE